LFLSRSFNWWYRAGLFRNLGLGILVFGLLLVWRGRSKNWSRLKMSMSYIVVLCAALLVVAVFTTGMVGLGRGRPVFLYNLLDLKRTTWAGPELSAGKHTIVFDFKSDGPELGKGGTGVLSVDGKEVARNSIEHGTPITFPEDETFDIGEDTRTGVALLEYRYESPFKFTGKINKLTFNLGREQLTAEERKQLPAIIDAVALAKD
jgi:arylsulfatase